MSTFTHRNKLTSRIVSKPLIGLITLNQALICTLIPNLMGVIQSESMISQAFQACYFIEGCLSNRCVLSWLGKTAKSLFIFLFFLIGLTTTRWSAGKSHVTLSQRHNGVMDGHKWSRHRSQVTVCHMTRVTWGPWESKRIATVAKCISR